MQHLFAGLLAGLLHAAAGQKPHIISILQDDLGYDDINLNSKWTKNITQLYSEGIQLTNHYTHWHWYVVAMTGATLHTHAVKISAAHLPLSCFLVKYVDIPFLCFSNYNLSSPTRRSFLSGRLPIHHGEQLSGDTTDDIDVRMEWVSSKLKKQGYR